MKTISGQLRRVTDPAAFLQSWVSTGGKPTRGHAPFGGARINFVSDFPGGLFSHSLLPSLSIKTDTDAQGSFAINVPDALANGRGSIIAFKVTTASFPGLPPIPVLNPVYRCQPFKISAVPASATQAARTVFVYEATTPDTEGVTQATVDKLVGDLRKKLKLDALAATIGSGKVSVKAKERGATIKFNAYVRGATVPDLARVIEVKAGEIDWDLPGPDFITTLCVNEAEIESQVRAGLADLSKSISKVLLATIDKLLPIPGLASQSTVSVWRTRFVQTGTKKIQIGPTKIEVPVFAAVPDGALGLPRSLY